MPTFHKACDVYQGYRYKKDVQTAVGFLTTLEVGGTTLEADQVVTSPLAPERGLPVVAVCTGVMWELGVTDALYVTGQISAPNKQRVEQLIYKGLTRVDVAIAFAVHAYDPIRKAYYEALGGSGATQLHGLLEKNGDDLNLAVADDPSIEVQSPLNYSFQIGIKPRPSAQTITLATSSSDKVVRAWGANADR